jgi:hypothetical protein
MCGETVVKQTFYVAEQCPDGGSFAKTAANWDWADSHRISAKH